MAWAPQDPGAIAWSPSDPGDVPWGVNVPGAQAWSPAAPAEIPWAPEAAGQSPWEPCVFACINDAATITGLWTFDRDTDAPFAVTPNSAVVPNLDSDLLDGEEGSFYLAWANFTGVPATFPPSAHASDHQNGGGDEINVGGLSGLLADAQTPLAHVHAAGDITSGTFADALVAESNVTQHEGAIDHNALTNYAVGQHRIINDAGTSATELWSAQKIDATAALHLPLAGGTMSGSINMGTNDITNAANVFVNTSGTTGISANMRWQYISATSQINALSGDVMIGSGQRLYCEAVGTTKGTESIRSSEDGVLDYAAATRHSFDTLIDIPTTTSTVGQITQNGGTRIFHTFGTNNLWIGEASGNFTLTGSENAAVGFNSLAANTTGTRNMALGVNTMAAATTMDDSTAIGHDAMRLATTGIGRNVGIGTQALRNCATSAFCVGIGFQSLLAMTAGTFNTAIGYQSLFSTSTGDNNTAVGFFAGAGMTTLSGSVFLGFRAGQDETDANVLHIDNQDRTSKANGKITSLIYGVFNAATASQLVRLNSVVEIRHDSLMIGQAKWTFNDAAKSINFDTTDLAFITDTGEFNFTGGPIGIHGQEEIRFYEGANYVGFEAPTLAANQIWILPATDGDPGGVMTTDGAGNLSFTDNASEKTFAFGSRDAASGTNYAGGFYKFGATDNDFNPAVNFGTANVAYGAHVFLVQAAGAGGGTDTVVRVSGTSMTDGGVRTAADTEDLTLDDAGAAGDYVETTLKWVGTVTLTKISGPDLLCNYGYCKYWDNNNTNFRLAGIEATWLGAKNDANPDIQLRHHRPTGWTYNAGAAPTPPAAVASMATDYDTEIEVATDQEGAWKRDDLTEDIDGAGGEGTLIEITTTTNRTYANGNCLLRIVPQP